MDRQTFTSITPAIRLDAFENYIRGIIAGSNAEKIAHFREAVRLNPAYNEAWLHLGKTYFENRQYDPAIAALSHVPPTDAGAGEANFFLGCLCLQRRRFLTGAKRIQLRCPAFAFAAGLQQSGRGREPAR